VSPVTYNGNPVILSANANVTSNYPASAVKTAFAAIAGSLSTGTADVTYAPYATLLSMEEIPAADALTASLTRSRRGRSPRTARFRSAAARRRCKVVATLDTISSRRPVRP
jgi:hypothetical protein